MNSISCIVSAFKQPEHLWICLASLRVQREIKKPWGNVPLEIIVTDDAQLKENEAVANHYGCTYLPTNFGCCYSAAEEGVKLSTGDWLCFPSHDNWYVPEFAARMLRTATLNNLDLVYCDLLHDPRYTGHYEHIVTKPERHRVDKGGFIVTKDLYKKIGGFSGKCANKRTVSDGIFVEAAAKLGKIGKVKEILFYHG